MTNPAKILPRCPQCGYTKEDANFHMDHHLCERRGGKIPENVKEDIVPCKEAFEKHFESISIPPHPPTRQGDGYLEHRSWTNWQAAWNAALNTRPTNPPDEKEVGEAFKDIISDLRELRASIRKFDDGILSSRVSQIMEDIRLLQPEDDEINLENVISWADGIHDALHTEYASRVTENEAYIADCILRGYRAAQPKPSYETGWDDAMQWCAESDLIKDGVEIPKYTPKVPKPSIPSDEYNRGYKDGKQWYMNMAAHNLKDAKLEDMPEAIYVDGVGTGTWHHSEDETPRIKYVRHDLKPSMPDDVREKVQNFLKRKMAILPAGTTGWHVAQECLQLIDGVKVG